MPDATMRLKLPAVRRAMQSTVWAIRPEKLAEILEVVSVHAQGGGFTAEEIRARVGDARKPAAANRGGIQVIPVYGVIAHRMDLMTEMSGGTSTLALADQFDAAMADPNISTIVLDVDSPGGSTDGVPELAARIYDARGQGKRTVAVANTLMASAAYWIGAAADEVVATPSAMAGSIGVFAVHLDESALNDKMGLKHTIISAGTHKTDGNPYEPLSEDARAALQASVDEYYAMFTGDVARFRGTSAQHIQTGYGEGRVLTAAQSLGAGLVDRIDTLEGVLAQLGAGAVSASGRPRHAAAVLHSAGIQAITASAGGAAPVLLALVPDADRPHQAKEHTVALDTAPAPNGAVGANPTDIERAARDAREAEQTRAKSIRAIARTHNVPEDQIDALVDDGLSIDAACERIVAAKQAARDGAPVIHVGATREVLRPWETFGHFATAVMHASAPGNKVADPRLLAAATGVNQAIPSEGGFLVPPSFSTTIWDLVVQDPQDMLSLTEQYPIEGESLTLPAVDETTRADGTIYGGTLAYWINEADQITKSKPRWRSIRLEPQELAVLIAATDKSLRNSPAALQTFLERSASAAIRFKIGNAIMNGGGNGQPLGFLNSGANVSVAKETNQPAATINQINISKMWARLHPAARAGAIWMHNVDIEPQLDNLSTLVKNVAGTENVGGYANKVFDPERRTLKGRPLMACEYCKTLGTKGDLCLVNLKWYATGLRSSGIRTDVSIHVRFEFAESEFRFMYEVDGKPILLSPLTPLNGTNTLSSFVSLDTRA